MFDVHAIELFLIVRKVICAGIVAMVAAAVFELISCGSGDQTGRAAGEGGPGSMKSQQCSREEFVVGVEQ